MATLAVAAQQTDSVAPQRQRVVLTLDQCIEIALDKSPSLKVADLEITRVDYSRKEILGQLLPSVSFGGTYSRMIAKQVMYMNMDKFAGLGGAPSEDTQTSKASSKNDGIKMGLDNSFQVGFNAAVPVIAPQLWQSLKLSDAQIAQTVEQARASRLNMVDAVKSAFYAWMLATDSRRVIQESYDMAALTHKIYSDQFAAGAASEFDVLRTSVAVKNIEPEITRADIAISQARLQLLILMGFAVDVPVTFQGNLNDYAAHMYDDVLALGESYENNTQLVQNRLQTNTLERALKVQKMALYPTLALSANYNWTSSSDGNPFRNFRWSPYSIVGLTLNLPLYTGGQRYSKIKQAQVQVQQARLQREDIENSVAMQVRLARENIAMNAKDIASCSESVGQAERAYNIMRESFDIGAASYLDLRDSELALTNARLKYSQSIYNYLVAASSLELLLGNAAQ